MKILLVAINAKYIHSNLAVYCLKSYAAKREIEVELTEYTINHRRDDILMDINPLQNFVAQIKSADSDSVIYVSTYGYEITNSKGEKSTYADALWIDTVLPISQI